MSILKQSTAATIKLGPFVDDGDGKTAEDGLTISQADIRLSKNGGDIAQSHDATGATHDELGYYNVPLDATDTDTLGRLRVAVSEAGALPVWQDFIVVTANVFDSLFSTDKLDCAVVEIADDVITAAAVKADAVTKIQNGLAIEATLTAMKGAGWSTETLAAIDIILDAIKAKTDLLTTGTAVSITSAVEGSEITGYIGATIEFALTGLGNISTYTKLYVTVKRDLADADSASIIQLEKTAGLVYINGATATTAANGTLTVDDAVAGNITGVLKPAESVKLSSGRYQYDVKGITTAGRAVIISTSEFTLADAVTKAIT